MVYAPEEKRKMDQIAKVFSQYVADSTEIDLAYTDKTGYVRLIIDECADNFFFPIQDGDHMLEMFIYDFFMDELIRCGYYNSESGIPQLDRVHADLHARLSTLEDRAHALNFLQTSWQDKVNSINES